MTSVDPQLWGLIQRYARPLHLDPYAVAAVSIMEGGGRFGEVGDNGTSFGPFQLHVGGALPHGRNAAWANSPAGVQYAMQQMSHVAGGMRGRQAIANIVSRFERPASPAPEISGAVSRYNDLTGQHLPSAPYTPGAASGGGGARGGGTRGASVAALAMLLSQHLPTAAPTSLNLPTPQSALQSLEPPAYQSQPVYAGIPGQLTDRASALQSSLQATRRALLGGV